MNDATLLTDRLHLRLLDAREPAHEALYLRLHTCSRTMAWIGPTLPPAEVEATFVTACRHNARARPGHRFWSFTERHSARDLGIAALQRRGQRAEFGVIVQAGSWQQGFASEVLAALLPYAFDSMGVEAVEVRRPDDAQGAVVQGLLAPFGFESAEHVVSGMRGWSVDRARWAACEPSALGFAIGRR